MFNFSNETLQSVVSKNFKNVYGYQLSSMLNVLSKFRNVCAHGERLYNYKTQKSIRNLPIYSKIANYHPSSKNDLFSVYICFKYLSNENDFLTFTILFENVLESTEKALGGNYFSAVLKQMGFPSNWKDIITLEK